MGNGGVAKLIVTGGTEELLLQISPNFIQMLSYFTIQNHLQVILITKTTSTGGIVSHI